MNKSELIERAIKQMQEDISSGDLTAIYEMLNFLPDENLRDYLTDVKE